MSAAVPALDESLYSRQLYVLGKEAMEKMNASRILLVGLRGLGAEIAKNIVLGGVRSLSIYDPSPTAIQDLSSQFFLTEADIGAPIDETCLPRIQELNNYVQIDVFRGDLSSPESYKDYHQVVLTDASFERAIHINDLCRMSSTHFTYVRTMGLFGLIFNDFGDAFEVVDRTGEPLLSCMIASITQNLQNNSLSVATLDETRHGLEDGDRITFSEVQGCQDLQTGQDLNTAAPLAIKVTGPYTFEIPNFAPALSEYIAGGIATQTRKSACLKFACLSAALETPDFLITDFANPDYPIHTLYGFHAADLFMAAYHRKPAPRSLKDAEAAFQLLASKRLTRFDDINKDIIHEILFQSCGDIPAIQSVIGGTAAQEVMKACSGKFSPIPQFMTFDSLESLPKQKPSEEDCQPINCRYDGQLAVFGRTLTQQIHNLQYFLVGAGAIGCETLKNWAMMGLSSGPKGAIHITDMDTIEKSNLNRQFLFRPWDVSKFKSETAADAVRKINPCLNIITYQDRVGEETEHIYNADFFDLLDGVTNALDNLEARRYVDNRCVLHRKSLIESGTLGTKGNVQIVVPHLTESYSSSQDPPEKAIPICTLKNFPNQVEHTIQWGRDLFEGLFTKMPETSNMYLCDPKFLDSLIDKQESNNANTSEAILILEGIVSQLVTQRPADFKACIAWARLRFEELFYNQIAQLLYNFPPNQVTTTGAKFWSPPKRCPTPLIFNANDPTHLAFIHAAANLYAYNYRLSGSDDLEYIRHISEAVSIPKFSPKAGVTIKVSDGDHESNSKSKSNANMSDESAGVKSSLSVGSQPSSLSSSLEEASDVERDLDGLIKQLPPVSAFKGFRLNPSSFEKDDDTNHHISFITAASNLRCLNYGIPMADRFKTKGIAGKIIPAIATTTSVVVGLGCLELYKLCFNERDIERYRNSFINLALPFFGFSEPIAAAKQTYFGISWTLWDRFDVAGPLTLGQFIEQLEKAHGFRIDMISSGVSMLYSSFLPGANQKEKMDWTLKQCIEKITQKLIPASQTHVMIEILALDDEDNDLDVPPVRYELNE